MNLSLLFASTAVAVISFFVDPRSLGQSDAVGIGLAGPLVTATGCASPMPAVPWSPLDAFGQPKPPADFLVTTSGSTSYVINGQFNPTLTLTRGQTYIFDLSTVSIAHPFLINSNAGNTGGTIYAGPATGTLVSFTPDFVMPSTIYYHCGNHAAMTGAINLVPPADFTVTTNGASDYVINGQLDPTLTLNRGQTYVLNLIGVSGAHPFVINSNAANAGGTIYAGPATATTITFTPDFVMPSTIYYHCSVHSGSMAGTINLVSPSVQVAAKVFLEGPFVSGTALMGDGLRAAGIIPLTEPYTALGYVHVGGGGETVSPPVLAVTGNNAIVDWVVVELRDEGDPSVIVATRSALVQRDGDVVSTNGTSPVSLSIAAGIYNVALRHRIHLGVMTQDPLSLSAVPTTVDLTSSSTVCFGTDARRTVGSNQVLWAGDVTFNSVVQYTGANNDRDPILLAIGGSVPTNTVTGYGRTDVNMDGTSKYTGALNDRDPILLNIGGGSPTLTRLAQLP